VSSSRWLTRGLPAAIAAGGLLLVLFLVWPWLHGWNVPPTSQGAAARQALDAAVARDARRLAPAEMAAAEAAFAEALRAEAVQGARWPATRRDYRLTAAAYTQAVAAAESTGAVSASRKAAAVGETKTLVTLADTMVTEIERMANDMPFSRKARTSLRNARTAVSEARRLLAAGRYADAGEAAGRGFAAAEEARDAALPAAARFADSAQVKTWRKWIDETVAWSGRAGKPAIVVYKEKRLLVLYERGRPAASFTADLGRNRLQPKHHAGDKATPEGRYRVTAKKQNGQSKYYKALLLDYPNAEDRARFERERKAGRLPAGATPGADIEIHGEGGRDSDWTLGCVALANDDIDAVFRRVEVGTPVTIVGGDGRDGIFSNLWRRHAVEGGTR